MGNKAENKSQYTWALIAFALTLTVPQNRCEAQSGQTPLTSGFYIEQVNPALDMKPFVEQGHTIKDAGQRVPIERDRLPGAATIRAALVRANLLEETKDWKQLDLDRLFIMSRSREPEEVARIFKSLPLRKLVALKEALSHE